MTSTTEQPIGRAPMARPKVARTRVLTRSGFSGGSVLWIPGLSARDTSRCRLASCSHAGCRRARCAAAGRWTPARGTPLVPASGRRPAPATAARLAGLRPFRFDPAKRLTSVPRRSSGRLPEVAATSPAERLGELRTRNWPPRCRGWCTALGEAAFKLPKLDEATQPRPRRACRWRG